MAGFAILYQSDSSATERESSFHCLLQQTAQFKLLDLPATYAVGKYCTAAKLDAPSSLHCGIIRDERSGSWLLAAGTVVALEGNNDPHVMLENLLVDFLDNGSNALERYDGHFALVIFNGRDNSLSIISDPIGLFAIYYARRGQQVLVSSSALALAQQIGSKADTLTIECFLRMGRPYGEKTLWQDVKRVRPATLIKITPEKFEESEYWTPIVDHDVARLSMNAAVELADEKICRVFELVLTREGKVWADLTGGFDTRLTTLYLDKARIPFTAYCIGPDGHPDVEVSRLVGKTMGWEYRHMPLPDGWAEEATSRFDAALGKGDGLLNIFQLAGVLRGAQERSHSFFVSITGMGVDEWRWHILGSNILIPAAFSRVDYDHLIDAKIMDDIPSHAMRHNRAIEARNEIKEHFTRSIASYRDSAKVTQIDIAWIRWRHPIHVGAYMSAQAGIMRSLTPFCFKELENYGLSVNHQWRIKYDFRFVRNLMERGNPRLANIFTVNGAPAMPIQLTNLHRFGSLWIDLADLMLGKVSMKIIGKRLSIREPQHYPTYPLPAWKAAWLRWAAAEDLLTPEKMRSSELFNPPVLAELVAQGLAGSHSYSEFLDRVITVEMALRATGASVE
jgi:asparagine synthetase B (glutamine-hydrolysing)